jgi:RNA polymerase sigma factor (sigma-70 family)
MAPKRESDFAEINIDWLIEQFPNEASAYHKTSEDQAQDELFDQFRSRLKWHLAHSLSVRQKEVMILFLQRKTEREIATVLGVKQQVVNTYKRRAINRLRKLLIK